MGLFIIIMHFHCRDAAVKVRGRVIKWVEECRLE